jgi:hypothetical protein
MRITDGAPPPPPREEAWDMVAVQVVQGKSPIDTKQTHMFGVDNSNKQK